MFLTGAVRGDDNSAFGENFDFVVYPKVSAAWVASEEPFWSVPFVNTLKLRAAWGRAGQQPDVFAATRLYEPATGRGGIPTLTPSNIGNPDLQPEVGQELELGFDASLLDQKLTIDFTYYDQTRRDAIVPAAALPSMGFPGTQFVNVGEVSNKGFEVALGTQVLRSEDWGLDLGASYATTDNKVVDLGGITPPLIGLPWPGQRHVEGYPVASMFMKKVVSAEWDASGDLVNVMCEGGDPIFGGGPPVPCAEAGTAYWGSPTPTWDVAATANLRFRQWTLSATADGQGGYYKCNGDIAWANVFFRNTHEINLPPGQQDPILAAYDQMGFVCQAGAVDSGFAKLRDITLRWDLPSSLASHLGAARATAQLSAHNMFVLWQATRELYGTRVIDPEVHSNTDWRGDVGDKGAYVQDLWPQLQRIDFTIRAVF
ncbi:MAG: TonB-dependent receptor [Gemmatimonadetes bacterium]|nr:TonB-dependent receptor [Gemmatimonadota bacterium]